MVLAVSPQARKRCGRREITSKALTPMEPVEPRIATFFGMCPILSCAGLLPFRENGIIFYSGDPSTPEVSGAGRVWPQDGSARDHSRGRQVQWLMSKGDGSKKYTEVPDETLVDFFNRGKRDAFVELVQRYQGRIVNFIYRTLGDIDRSEELAQESFLRAFRKADSFDSRYRFSTWLYTIARNLASNELRDRSRRPLAYTIEEENWAGVGAGGTESDNAAALDPERALLNKEMKQSLEKALSHLSVEHRMALILKEYDGLTYGEIADILETSAGTVKSWVYRAKREIFKILKEMGAV